MTTEHHVQSSGRLEGTPMDLGEQLMHQVLPKILPVVRQEGGPRAIDEFYRGALCALAGFLTADVGTERAVEILNRVAAMPLQHSQPHGARIQ